MKFNVAYNPLVKADEDVDLLTEESINLNLIVWNDEINTFDWVIDTLMSVCGHEKEQAEQCTLLIHLKGKCSVKNGSYDELKVQKDAITDRLINATIE